jgi:hypothetical protein
MRRFQVSCPLGFEVADGVSSMIGNFGMSCLFDGMLEPRDTVVVGLCCDAGRLVPLMLYDSEQPTESIDITDRRAKKPDAIDLTVMLY